MSQIIEAVKNGAARVPPSIGSILKNGLVGGTAYGAGTWGVDELLGVDPSKLPDTSTGGILKRLGKDAVSMMPWSGTNPGLAPAGTNNGWTAKDHARLSGSVDTTGMDEAAAEATATGQQIQAGLAVTVTPHVDFSYLDILLAKIRQAKTELQSLGGAGAASGAAVDELRAANSDFGVAP